MDVCTDGKHDLEVIWKMEEPMHMHHGVPVVRWCRCCGAVVVDREVDGRLTPGGIVEMQFSALYRERLEEGSKHEEVRSDGKD